MDADTLARSTEATGLAQAIQVLLTLPVWRDLAAELRAAQEDFHAAQLAFHICDAKACALRIIQRLDKITDEAD